MLPQLDEPPLPYTSPIFQSPTVVTFKVPENKRKQGTLQVGKIREGETPTLKITREQPEIHRTTGTRYSRGWLSQQPRKRIRGSLGRVHCFGDRKMCTFVKEVQDGTVGPSGGWGEGVAPSPGSEGNSPV